MDPAVQIAIDVVGALIRALGPLAAAALSHHGYVPRRVEAVLGPDDHGHASEAVDELRGTAPANPSPVEPEGGHSPRGVFSALRATDMAGVPVLRVDLRGGRIPR